MTNEQIDKFLQQKRLDKMPVRISFKTRKPFVGIFIETPDYAELKSKNFWRIVSETSTEAYIKTKNTSLARIYNGAEFTKLNDL